MNAEQQIRKYNKYLKTLRRSEDLLRATEVNGCITLEQVNEQALKSNAECQKLIEMRIKMLARELVKG